MSRAVFVVAVVLFGCGKSSQHHAGGGSAATGSAASGGSATSNGSDESDMAGGNAQEQPAARIATFWTWFSQHAAELKAEPDLQKVMEAISAETAKIDPGIIGEVAVDGTKRQLVLSADGKRALFPQVQALYAARPEHIEGWSVVAFRPRDEHVEGMTIDMGGKKIDVKHVKFVATAADHKLDVVVFIPHFTTVDEMGSLGFVLLDHTVGEYDMETKIGGVDFASLDKAPATAKPLAELPRQVDALK